METPQRLADHELIRRIATGSYGEVWLARSELGTYRAIKIIQQARFDTDRPFLREYEGIQKFEPVSRSHEGFVDILQVGRGPDANSFYYIMELADDLTTGAAIDPSNYSPRTLASEVKARGPLAPDECVQIGIRLCRTLAFLHDRGLLHRDVKPGNVIFVENQAKLADIGLITEIDGANTCVGTVGFIAPEGPNSARADLYGLGKLLYEVSTGKDRHDFPALPDRSEFSREFLELNEVIVVACNSDPNQRYRDGLAMAADLELIATGKSVRRLHALEAKFKRLRNTAPLVLAGLIAVGAIYLQIASQVQHGRERRASLIGSKVALGTARMRGGDLLGALPLFVESMRLDQGKSITERTHRLRIGSILAFSPKMRNWRSPDRPIGSCAAYENLAAISFDGRYSLVLNLDSGRVLTPELDPAGRPIMATFMPGGQRILTSNYEHRASIIDWTTGQVLESFPHPETVRCASASPDGSKILTGCYYGQVYLWDVAKGTAQRLGRHGTNDVLVAKFNREGTLGITGGGDNLARVWDVVHGVELKEFPHRDYVYDADFSPDGQNLATACYDNEVHLWNLKSGDEIYPSLPNHAGVASVQYSADGKHILSAAMDGAVRLWDTQTHQLIALNHTLNHNARLYGACFARGGSEVITAGADGVLTLWDFRGLPLQPTLLGKAPPPNSAARLRSPDSRWRLRLGDRTATLTLEGSSREIRVPWKSEISLYQFSPDNACFAVADGTNIHLLHLESGQSFDLPHPKPVTCVQFSPDSAKLACASRDDSFDEMYARLWNTATGNPIGQPLKHKDGILSVAFSPDSQRLITTSEDNSARVWNANTGDALTPRMHHRDKVHAASFALQNPWVVTASDDKTAIIWDANTGDPLTPPFPHALPLIAAGFVDNDTALMTTDSAGNRWKWDLPIEKRPLAALEKIADSLSDLQNLSDSY